MNRLFTILDGINSSDHADDTLASVRDICSYAEACGEAVSNEEALRIQTVGLQWREEQKNGNGEWGRMRDEAIQALDESDKFAGITVHSLQLSGNIGDGWADENAAIDVFAEYLQAKLEAALPGADITVTTQHNTSGYDSGPVVGGPNTEDGAVLVQIAEGIVEAINQTAFDEFCNSPEAAQLLCGAGDVVEEKTLSRPAA